MRITFVVAALAALSYAVTLPENNFAQIQEHNHTANKDDGGLKEAKKAKKVLSKAKTKDNFHSIKHPFTHLEGEIDGKIAGQRKKVEEGVKNVQKLNQEADKGIADARAAVEKKAEAEKKKEQAEKEEEAAVENVKKAKELAKEQKKAQKDARAAKLKAVDAQTRATKSFKKSKAALKKADDAKHKATKLAKDRQSLIDATAKKTAKIIKGTEAAKSGK